MVHVFLLEQIQWNKMNCNILKLEIAYINLISYRFFYRYDLWEPKSTIQGLPLIEEFYSSLLALCVLLIQFILHDGQFFKVNSGIINHHINIIYQNSSSTQCMTLFNECRRMMVLCCNLAIKNSIQVKQQALFSIHHIQNINVKSFQHSIQISREVSMYFQVLLTHMVQSVSCMNFLSNWLPHTYDQTNSKAQI